jgi:hypothetical protein
MTAHDELDERRAQILCPFLFDGLQLDLTQGWQSVAALNVARAIRASDESAGLVVVPNIADIRAAVEQAMDYIRGETPEYGTAEDAKIDTIMKLRAADIALAKAATDAPPKPRE